MRKGPRGAIRGPFRAFVTNRPAYRGILVPVFVVVTEAIARAEPWTRSASSMARRTNISSSVKRLAIPEARGRCKCFRRGYGTRASEDRPLTLPAPALSSLAEPRDDSER